MRAFDSMTAIPYDTWVGMFGTTWCRSQSFVILLFSLTKYLQGPPMKRFPATFASVNGISMSSYISETCPLDFHWPRRYFSSLLQPFFLVCVMERFLTLWLPIWTLFSGPLNSGWFNISVLNTFWNICFDWSHLSDTSLFLLKTKSYGVIPPCLVLKKTSTYKSTARNTK